MLTMLNNLPVTEYQLRHMRGNQTNNITYINEIHNFVQSKNGYNQQSKTKD